MSPSVDPEDGSAAQLARRDRILAAVARVAERLAEPKPWQQLADEVLRILGEAAGVSRVYIFEHVRGPKGERIVNQSFEWCGTGVAPQIDMPELQGLDLDREGYTRWAEYMTAGRPIFGDIGDFPASERPLLEAQGIYSLLAVPIFAGTRWWGLIGFDACTGVHSWSKVEADVLHIASRTLGAVIHQQEREKLLRRAQKMEALGRMAGGIAHDANNLLLVLTGELDILRHGLEDQGLLDAERKESFALLQQTLRQSASFNRRLLDFSKSREGKPELLPLGTIVRRAEPLLKQAAGSMVRTTIATAAGEPPVRVDAVQIEQALLNLVVNAKDAMPQGGTLQIAVDVPSADDSVASVDGVPNGSWVRLRVADSGEGIPAELLDKIFEPFFTTKGSDKGTGLGLSTTYSVVRGAGGHIAVTSTPGAGAEFRLYFPAAIALVPTAPTEQAAGIVRGA
jgi:signal transduction histidine kinase